LAGVEMGLSLAGVPVQRGGLNAAMDSLMSLRQASRGVSVL